MQERLKLPERGMTITKIWMKFRIFMSKGNVNGALKLLANNMSNGILTLINATLQLLKKTHPESRESPLEVLIERQITQVNPFVYNNIVESLILKAAMLMKGGSAPSGLDADG